MVCYMMVLIFYIYFLRVVKLKEVMLLLINICKRYFLYILYSDVVINIDFYVKFNVISVCKGLFSRKKFIGICGSC